MATGSLRWTAAQREELDAMLVRLKTRAALSAGEADVLRLYASGRGFRQIARRLGVTEGTVTRHLERVRATYEAQGRPAATQQDLYQRAVEDGYLSRDPVDH